jgi:hypothetical protein
MRDWLGKTLRLSKQGLDDWTCTGVSVQMNAREVVHFEDVNGFVLTSNNSERRFPLPPN